MSYNESTDEPFLKKIFNKKMWALISNAYASVKQWFSGSSQDQNESENERKEKEKKELENVRLENNLLKTENEALQQALEQNLRLPTSIAVSKEHIRAFVDHILKDPHSNASSVPDWLEGPGYRMALEQLFSVLHHVLQHSSVRLPGHEVRFVLRPLTQIELKGNNVELSKGLNESIEDVVMDSVHKKTGRAKRKVGRKRNGQKTF